VALPRFGSCGTEIPPLLAVELVPIENSAPARPQWGRPSSAARPDVRSPRMRRTSSRQASCLALAAVNDQLVLCHCRSRGEAGRPSPIPAPWRGCRRYAGQLEPIGFVGVGQPRLPFVHVVAGCRRHASSSFHRRRQNGAARSNNCYGAGRVESCSARLRFLGLEPRDLAGQRLLQLLSPARRHALGDHVRTAQQVPIRRRDGANPRQPVAALWRRSAESISRGFSGF
jgi:hypothetical protein